MFLDPTPKWIAALTDHELEDAIESTGHMAARLYDADLDTTEVDATLDQLMDEADRRAAR